MKRVFIISSFIFLSFALFSQEVPEPDLNAVKHSHQVKLGSSLQYDFGGYQRYDEFGYYYDNHYSTYSTYDGPNTQVFVTYEHIWTYASKLALGIEPRLRIVTRDNSSLGGILGANWKFYWGNNDFWRMGISMLTSYEYSSSKRDVYISMDNGMYSQLKEINLRQSVFSFDLGFVPFQFKIESVPLLMELNLTLIGMHVFRTNSKKYDTGNGNTDRYHYSRIGGYGPKIEFRIGWQL